MTYRLFRFLTVLLLMLPLWACKDGSNLRINSVPTAPAAVQAAATDPTGQPKAIALVMKTLTNPFFIAMEQGARRAERQLGVRLLVKAASQETSIEQQIQIVDELIAAQVDAIVIAPGDSHRLVPVLKKAADAGIKLVNLDNRLDQQTVQQMGLAPIPLISVDNEQAAYAAVRWLRQGLPADSPVVLLEGIRSAENARQRHQGAIRALTEAPALQVVASQSAHWKIDEGYAATQELLGRYPQTKLLYAANDMMALGAIRYLQEQGRRDVKVGGFDAIAEAQEAMAQGWLQVTVDQQAAEQGFQGVMLASRLLQGETVPQVTLIDAKLLTAPRPH